MKMSVLLRQPPKKGQFVTLVITDIEGSTSLWDSKPREMNEALATHDALLRSLMRTHHGYDLPCSMNGGEAGMGFTFSIELDPNNSGVRGSTGIGTMGTGAPVSILTHL